MPSNSTVVNRKGAGVGDNWRLKVRNRESSGRLGISGVLQLHCQLLDAHLGKAIRVMVDLWNARLRGVEPTI